MRTAGHGIDIVETRRIAEALAEPGDVFSRRCFTERERADAEQTPDRVRFFAGRFAAKEAVLKALGTGWGEGVAWTDVEIQGGSGRPTVLLSGRAEDRAREAGIVSWWLSLSHTEDYAVASAIAEAA